MEDAYTLFTPKSPFDEFHLCFCGKSVCCAGHSYGPNVRQVYVLHYVIKGQGTYKVDGKSYQLKGGQGFLIEPGALTYYEADQEDPWEYIWIGFTGGLSESLLESIGLGNDNLILSTEHGQELRDLIEMMLRFNQNTLADQFMLQSLLCSFLEVLSRNSLQSLEVKPLHVNSYVQQAVNYIENNFSSNITIQSIADYINIDRSYLFYLFKKERGCSIQQYLTDYRISYAKTILESTDYSVEAVCYACGYRNPETFTKAFKKHVGMAPGQFRKSERNFHKLQSEKVEEHKNRMDSISKNQTEEKN